MFYIVSCKNGLKRLDGLSGLSGLSGLNGLNGLDGLDGLDGRIDDKQGTRNEELDISSFVFFVSRFVTDGKRGTMNDKYNNSTTQQLNDIIISTYSR